MADFRAAHDKDTIIPNRIRAALAKMQADHGKEHYEYQRDFIVLAGVNQNDLSKYADQFAEHIVIAKAHGARGTNKVAWFGNAASARKIRGDDVTE